MGKFRRFIAKNTLVWSEVARRPERRRDDLDVVFFATPAPSSSVEGYRIVWIRSWAKEVFDAEARRRAIELGRVALFELDEKLSGPRCRLKDETSVKAAADAAVERARASRWVQARITTETVVRHKQHQRGRPGPNTAYVRVEQQRYSVAAVIADAVVRDDALFDGCWPLVTNDTQMTEANLLAVYRRQPGVENRHHVLKGVVDFVSVYLKSNERNNAFAFLGYIAVLVHALIERDLRRAMRDADLAELALYPEDRACKGPTAARVIEIFELLCAHELVENGQILKRYDPSLSKLHRQILDLLKVPATTYQAARTASL